MLSLGRACSEVLPRQELQQKRAQKSGGADGAERGLLKEAWEAGKPRPAQELPPRAGSAARQPHKANNAGEERGLDPGG